MNETLQQAKEFIELEDFDQAVSLLTPLAESNNAEAQFLLGYLFFTCAEVGFEESERWLEKASAQNHAEAIYYLATSYRDGHRVFDEKAFVFLLHRAGELGSVNAQYLLGAFYATGNELFQKNEAEAVKWYSKAAEQANGEAQYNLATMYLNGEGTEKDVGKGILLLEQAVANGYDYAADFLSDVYKDGHFGIIRNSDKANYWRGKAGIISLMIVAGEASGDKHGAKLAAALQVLQPDVRFDFFGAGGDEMRSAGVETLVDAREVAIMGALEVAKALPKFLRVFRRLREAAKEQKPDLVVLIDWPEFNLRLAKRLRQDGHRVAYYISPQIWAWRSYRIRGIRRDVEKMLVILPFEQDYYRQRGVEVEYVGHPLLDSVRVTASREEFCSKNGLDTAKPIVALLPGSRHSELKHILPPLLETAARLGQTHPHFQLILPLARTFKREEITTELQSLKNLTLIEHDTYNAVAAADLAVVASGTATLETAIIGTPLIVVYRASALNWRIFWPLINTEFVGMPNLIAGKEIAPELLQDDLNTERLSKEVVDFLGDSTRLAKARNDLAEVRDKLGEANASERAAKQILAMVEKSKGLTTH
ncbi:MAG: lipid-A-disaccharide synthase [Acidobacteria bacterium]|nr:lipid-A-disaccharide synthase [Acidobacteriota bacterium]